MVPGYPRPRVPLVMHFETDSQHSLPHIANNSMAETSMPTVEKHTCFNVVEMVVIYLSWLARD